MPIIKNSNISTNRFVWNKMCRKIVNTCIEFQFIIELVRNATGSYEQYNYTNKCVISEIYDKSLIISDMGYVLLLCSPCISAVMQWTAHSDESPKPVRVMPFCVVIHDNIYKIAIKMDYLNRIRSHVKVKSINYYATYGKIYRRYVSKFNMG